MRGTHLLDAYSTHPSMPRSNPTAQVHGLDWGSNPRPTLSQADAVTAQPHLPGPLLYAFSPPSEKGDS